MTKKEYVIEVLTRLSGIWEYADALQMIISQTAIDQSVIDGLYTLMSLSITKLNDEQAKSAIDKSMQLLKKIAYAEEQEKLHLNEELDSLLNQI